MFECFDWEDAGSFCINCWQVFHTLHCVKQTNKRGRGGERHSIMSLAAECCRGVQVSVDYCFWLHFTWKRICTDGRAVLYFVPWSWVVQAGCASPAKCKQVYKKEIHRKNKQTNKLLFHTQPRATYQTKQRFGFKDRLTDCLKNPEPVTSDQTVHLQTTIICASCTSWLLVLLTRRWV